MRVTLSKSVVQFLERIGRKHGVRRNFYLYKKYILKSFYNNITPTRSANPISTVSGVAVAVTAIRARYGHSTTRAGRPVSSPRKVSGQPCPHPPTPLSFPSETHGSMTTRGVYQTKCSTKIYVKKKNNRNFNTASQGGGWLDGEAGINELRRSRLMIINEAVSLRWDKSRPILAVVFLITQLRRF